jgi:hypothetical protein
MSAEPVPHAQDYLIVFPATRCCNCGTTDGQRVKMRVAEFIRTIPRKNLPFSFPSQVRPITVEQTFENYPGPEHDVILTFKLPLPVCDRCGDSLSRPFQSNFDKFIQLFILTFALMAPWFTFGAETILNSRFHWIANNLFTVCLMAAALLLTLLYASHRLAKNQTSYYQPVRIGKCDWDYSTGEIQQIGFLFTNRLYRRDFIQANQEAVWSGSVLTSDC